jgi:hypothetical protein
VKEGHDKRRVTELRMHNGKSYSRIGCGCKGKEIMGMKVKKL